MTEKTTFSDVDYTSHKENTKETTIHDEAPQRQASVALNIVDNPLREQTVLDARTFAESHGMADDAALFGRAALVARDPERFESIPDLTEEERAALIYERDHKWHGPKMLWYSIGLCAIGAATQGWDQTGSNGANLSFPEEFGINKTAGDEWLVGLINSIIFLTAGLIGEIFLTAACLTATPIGSGFAQSWQGLFAARFIMGIGIGAKNATVPIYSAEMAPARIRGALVMFWQLWVVIDVPRIAWRLQLGSAFIPSFILMCGIFFCPESPRWLMKHGKIAQGFKSMAALRAHPIIGARDYYYSYIIYEEELKVASGSTYFTRLRDCFTVPRIRRANYGASTVMIAQQMCGINIISFYSSTIFTQAKYTNDQALYASLGYGAIQVIFTIPTLFLIDTKGRRTLCLIATAGLSLLQPDTKSPSERVGPVILFVYLFTICYSLGEGPVAFQYSAEVFPTIQPGILSLTFPRMSHVMTQTGAFGFYAALNLIAWFMIFAFVRETKQLTLEEIDQVFSVPTKTFLNYELTTWLPWFIKRHLLFQKSTPKPAPIIEKASWHDQDVTPTA
ncbi:unnamed protein product [Aureobasidium pullulans]|nr:unnamed protein product [Aureobasidium pullulans]